MAHVESFLRGNKRSLERIKPRDTTPVQIQVLSSSKEKLDRFLSEFQPFNGFMGFNLNLSCPSRDVIQRGKGAAMVKRVSKIVGLVSVIRDYGHPVSVKLRLGVNQQEKKSRLYLNSLGGVDPDFFVVHAKHAAQSSNAPEDNSVYPLCVEAARGIPVIANGGIETAEKVNTLMDVGVGGVMMGRSAMRNPAVFNQLKNELGFNKPPRKMPTVIDIVKKYDTIYDEIQGSKKYRQRFLGVLDEHLYPI
jgi:tRNA-dihydrouridine synthase